MENIKGSSNIRNAIYYGKHPLLPPKSPFPSISPNFVDYVPSPAIGPKGIAKHKEVNSNHQRTSSESFLMEEQPSWLDELLNEPETPVRKGGHRRSSSDSFAYIDVANASTIDYAVQDEYRFKNMVSVPSWGSQDFEQYKDVQHSSLGKPKNRARDFSLNSMSHPRGVLSARDNVIMQSSGSSCVPQEADVIPSTATEIHDPIESGPHDPKTASERKDSSHAKPSTVETDTKRAKQYVLFFALILDNISLLACIFLVLTFLFFWDKLFFDITLELQCLLILTLNCCLLFIAAYLLP
ncbi:hypothetical protein ACSBR2_022170 [Camellia fascicularis]